MVGKEPLATANGRLTLKHHIRSGKVQFLWKKSYDYLLFSVFPHVDFVCELFVLVCIQMGDKSRKTLGVASHVRASRERQPLVFFLGSTRHDELAATPARESSRSGENDMQDQQGCYLCLSPQWDC
jgi:hypothetical protein